MRLNKLIQIIVIVFTINSSVKAQIKIDSFKEATTFFSSIFSEESSLDSYGNLKIDMGSANSGRVEFRITDVNIKMEKRKEEPGCADICPPRILIHFDCKGANCVTDPSFRNKSLYDSGLIVFYNLKMGEVAYKYFIALQQYFINTICEMKNKKTEIIKE